MITVHDLTTTERAVVLDKLLRILNLDIVRNKEGLIELVPTVGTNEEIGT